MATITISKNSIKIGKEPVVVLPLKKWQKIEAIIEDLEDAVRFNLALTDPKNQKRISFTAVKKKLHLP